MLSATKHLDTQRVRSFANAQHDKRGVLRMTSGRSGDTARADESAPSFFLMLLIW
jgi:hypothetical protein